MRCTHLLELLTVKTETEEYYLVNGVIKWLSMRNQMVEHDVETGCIRNIRPVRGSRYREDCLKMRNDLKVKVYLNSEEASVPWQLDYVRRTYKN